MWPRHWGSRRGGRRPDGEFGRRIGLARSAGIPLSLPVCQVYRSYHHLQFVQSRLSPRMQALSHLLFDLLSLLFSCIVLWQLTRFVATTWRAEDVAPTLLGTPLWIPQAMMPLGMLAATVSLFRSVIGNWCRFRAGGV